MIFNTDYEGDLHSLDGIKATRNGYTLEAALMHVYENECNYNSIIKAAGISELRYYQETGRELFVHEAGAMEGFIGRIKEFFKKVIEKIKEIFKSFLAKINSLVMSDKDFVKKYEKELTRRSAEISSMEFEGWKFEKLESYTGDAKQFGLDTIKSQSQEFKDVIDGLNLICNNHNLAASGVFSNANVEATSGDNLSKCIEEIRGVLARKAGTKLDESEFREELHDLLYGTDKEDFKINIREQLGYIRECKKDCKEVDKSRKEICRTIDDYAKKLEDAAKEINKITGLNDDEAKAYANTKAQKDFRKNNNVYTYKGKDKTYTGRINVDTIGAKNLADGDAEEAINSRKIAVKVLDGAASIGRSYSGLVTTAFGMITQAYKDRNRQAKAICVKALSYKEESSFYGNWDDNYYNESNDLFAGVTIK